MIQEELRERRFATVVRLEVAAGARGIPGWMLELLFGDQPTRIFAVTEVASTRRSRGRSP